MYRHIYVYRHIYTCIDTYIVYGYIRVRNIYTCKEIYIRV